MVSLGHQLNLFSFLIIRSRLLLTQFQHKSRGSKDVVKEELWETFHFLFLFITGGYSHAQEEHKSDDELESFVVIAGNILYSSSTCEIVQLTYSTWLGGFLGKGADKLIPGNQEIPDNL